MEITKDFKRSGLCAEFSVTDIGREIILMGWVSKRRNLGSLIFIDLRDKSGIMQIVFDENVCGSDTFRMAGSLRGEYCIGIRGKVQKRAALANESLKTGEIEVFVTELRIFSASETPPFPIEEEINTKDELRLSYRYLDLRRPDLQRILFLRSRVTSLVRNFLDKEGFVEVETPILQKSTPEGARDYLVPSRVHPGNFYALPQSPQLFKQLLMCSGFDKYYQIAKCFRDEDLRAHRQPEFTQIDMELSFVDEDDVIDVNERLMKHIFKETLDIDIPTPFPRISWQEAMDKYGSDKPDIRFGMELVDISDIVSSCGFGVFTSAVESGGSVRGIRIPDKADIARKAIDKLTEEVKGVGAKGLAYIALQEGNIKSSFTKFISEDDTNKIIHKMGAKTGDLLLFIADTNKIVWETLGMLRLKFGHELELIDEDTYAFLWVVDFPLFEWSDTDNRLMAMHHPFTMPREEDLPLLGSENQDKMRAKAYDIVINGVELGGGSIRIHDSNIQAKMFEALGLSQEVSNERFGFLLEAFKYGVPPHGGLAHGLDRLIMLIAKVDSVRDVIAFPKIKDASDLMTKAPTSVDDKQLQELSLKITIE